MGAFAARSRIRGAVLVASLLAIAACGGGGEAGAGPSQSPADAARDGVVAELALLPLETRMEVVASVTTPDGVWVISRPTAAAEALSEECRFGPIEGKYPTDFICTTEYGELLLLDDAMSEIRRAYPLAGIPPTYLEVTDGAVYCGRDGEGMLPDSMVCRIDRQTLAAMVRVFPSEYSVVDQPCFYPPATWTVDGDYVDVAAFEARPDGVWAQQATGDWVRLDPITLAVDGTGLAGPGGA
jgi:hypothetical protein